MISKNKERNTAIFYTCGVCNLHCRYCGIDKNPVLKTIDEALAKSFEGDYYINRLKQYFKKGQLTTIETWGGEPFLHMDRIYPLVNQVIEYYPYFNSMYSSTNFSYPQWIDQVFGLFDQFGKYPHRDFYYCLQLSCDGPEYINDAGRGKGVTQKCLENFDKLVEQLKNDRLPHNVYLTITLKGTLDNDSIRKLCDKQKIIEYYQFFEENFIDKIRRLDNEKITMGTNIPNTAVPSPVTVEEGKIFAELCRLCREIERENIDKHYFKYYEVITPFTSDICQNCLTYQYNYHTCGTGNSMLGFLPDNMISTCHEGFTEFVEEYKKLAAESTRDQTSTITFDRFLADRGTKFCVDDEGYAEHERQMSLYNPEGASARLATIANEILCLSLAGQIKECYSNPTNALKAAIFIQSHTSYCIKDNYNKTGSITNVPLGLLKLLLNGAMEYIQRDGEELRV